MASAHTKPRGIEGLGSIRSVLALALLAPALVLFVATPLRAAHAGACVEATADGPLVALGRVGEMYTVTSEIQGTQVSGSVIENTRLRDQTGLRLAVSVAASCDGEHDWYGYLGRHGSFAVQTVDDTLTAMGRDGTYSIGRVTDLGVSHEHVFAEPAEVAVAYRLRGGGTVVKAGGDLDDDLDAMGSSQRRLGAFGGVGLSGSYSLSQTRSLHLVSNLDITYRHVWALNGEMSDGEFERAKETHLDVAAFLFGLGLRYAW